MAALVRKYIKRFSLKQVEDRTREVNFSISHHKNSILLILQKHFSSLTSTRYLFLFCDSFISALNIHTTYCPRYRKKMYVNSNRNTDNYSFHSAQSAIISHRYQPFVTSRRQKLFLCVWGDWRYNATHSQPRHQMQMSGQLNIIFFTPSKKNPTLSIEWGLGGSHTGSGPFEVRKIYLPCRRTTQKHSYPARSLVTIPTELSRSLNPFQ